MSEYIKVEKLKENLEFVTKINSKLEVLYQHLQSVMIRLQQNFDERVIKKDKYISLMEKLDELVVCFKTFDYPYNVEKIEEIDRYEEISKVYKFRDDLREIVLDCGMRKCSDIMSLLFDDFSVGGSYQKLLRFYDNYFVSSSVKIEKNPIDVDTDLEILPFAKKLVNPITLLEKIEGANITFPYGTKFIIVTGHFRKDPLNATMIGGTLGHKLELVKNKIKYLPIQENFKNGFLNQISIRDFLVSDEKEIVELIENSYKDLVKFRTKPLSGLVKEFITGTTDKQRHILTLFLLSDSEDQFLAHIIYDMICNTSDLLKPQPMAEEIYKCLHFSVQKLFRIAFKNVEKKIQDLQNITEEDIPYEKRIAMMKCNDVIKSKALDKLKEIKGTRESSAKAQQYLDGLLKVPFGTFKQEPVLGFLENYCSKINKFIQDNLVLLREKGNESELEKERVKKVVGLFEAQSELKTESQVEAFLQSVEKLYETKTGENSPKKEKEENDCIVNRLKKVQELAEMLDNDKDIEEKELENIENDSILIEGEISKGILDFAKDWVKFKQSKKDYLKTVREALNSSVYGHDESKDQLERLIAQWMTGKKEGTVFGFQGPPGCGKTTLAKKGLSKCLVDEDGNPRPFGFLPLGGSTNGAILEGHSYTYLGSTWGRIVDILMETKCMNPIIYIDEVDKVSNTEHGREIIGILTHLTDASQNNEFTDKYFSGIKFDLSKVLFVFSYNDQYALDRILRDRITEINIKPLSINEKLHIVKDYSFPEILEKVGYSKGDIVLDDEVIKYIIETYTNEAGVRKLNEKLFEIVREINLKRITDDTLLLPYNVSIDYVKDLFSDKPKVQIKKIAKEPMVGFVNGLYATVSGLGGITLIEVLKTPSDRKLGLELTGSMGDDMKESMSVAKTLAWNLIPKDVKKDINDEMETCGNFGLHINLPSISTPKSGPSGTAAVTVGIVSRLTGVPVRNDICITGEANLMGKVTAIGGLDSKLEGGWKAGCKTAIVPKENEDDIKKILKKRKDNGITDEWIDIKICETINEVLDIILVENEVKFNNV